MVKISFCDLISVSHIKFVSILHAMFKFRIQQHTWKNNRIKEKIKIKTRYRNQNGMGKHSFDSSAHFVHSLEGIQRLNLRIKLLKSFRFLKYIAILLLSWHGVMFQCTQLLYLCLLCSTFQSCALSLYFSVSANKYLICLSCSSIHPSIFTISLY